MNKTSIEWTHRPGTVGMTWNPIRARLKTRPLHCNCLCSVCARSNSKDSKTFDPEFDRHCHRSPCMVRTGTFCTRISPGCTNCYASAINKRFGNGLEYTVPNLEKVEFLLDEKILQEPLRTKKPCTIFVGDMFDLFHEEIPQEMLVEVFSVMAGCDHHVFQLLTKRAWRLQVLMPHIWSVAGLLPNIWLGVSVESQKYADERIPLLLQTPAAVRFLSVEPQLEAVNLRLCCDCGHRHIGQCQAQMRDDHGSYTCLCPAPFNQRNEISWVICGGESGPGARPFNLAWAESLQAQCKASGVPFFMKQLGSKPEVNYQRWLTDKRLCHGQMVIRLRKSGPELENVPIVLKDRKGGDIWKWPEHLRVREFPA
jgi:protein gp37